jgi:hypothetical protein
MAFEWKAFLDLAYDLRTRSHGAANPEAFLRTALSRAYYAAFCYARNYAQAYLKFDPRGDPDDHGRLRQHLRSKKRGGTATRLDRLRQWRNESDYHDELSIDLPIAVEAALAEAEYVFTSLPAPKKT